MSGNEQSVNYYLLVAAAALAVVYGVNAGGTMVATSLGIRIFRPIVSAAILGAAIAVAPLVAGTAVASTLAHELVSLGGELGQLSLLAAVVAALLVTTALSWLGIATSLTLALIGAIAGSGLGAGLDVAWVRVLGVLAGVAVAPLLGLGAAAVLRRVLPVLRWGRSAARWITGLHVVAFLALALAFGANDAQKLLAVVAVAAGTDAPVIPAIGWQLLLVGVLFAVGSAIGSARMARPATAGLLAVQPLDAAVGELATASVMVAGSAIGNPAGMAQTLSGSLIGIGLVKGRGRVRWEYAGRIVNAWAATMPAAFGLAWVLGAASRVLAG
jgi:PiT family inorganic phosphate transporter